MSEVAVSVFATWQARVRSRSYSTDGVRLSEIIRGVSEIRKWLPEVGLSNVRLRPGPHNSARSRATGADAPINTASFSLRSMGLSKVLMTYSIRHSLLSRVEILPKPNGSTAF